VAHLCVYRWSDLLLLLYYYSATDSGAEYCDERVCLCVSVCLSLRDHIFGTTRLIFSKVFVIVTYGRGSVLLWRRSDTLCTSGFMDDVIFAHQPRLARRRRPAEAQCTPSTTRSTQPCIPLGSLNRVPASAGVRAGMSPLPGGR